MKEIFLKVMNEFGVFEADVYYDDVILHVYSNKATYREKVMKADSPVPEGLLIIRYPFRLAFTICPYARDTIETNLKQLGCKIADITQDCMYIQKVKEN